MARTSAVLPDPVSERLLVKAVDRSQRHTGVQMAIPFIQSNNDDAPSPLAAMLRGGRGGEVRLKLYLCVCLLATMAPYDIRQRIPARTWAQMLALPDPAGNGARRIADALSWLENGKLVTLGRQAGLPPTITLRDPSGSGAAFSRPGPRWVSLPLGLWSNQWITTLSGAALALLLVLLELQGGREPTDPPFVPSDRRARYGLSGDTWTRATRELVALGLLEVGRVTQGEAFDWQRMRNTYWVDRARLDQKAPLSS